MIIGKSGRRSFDYGGSMAVAMLAFSALTQACTDEDAAHGPVAGAAGESAGGEAAVAGAPASHAGEPSQGGSGQGSEPGSAGHDGRGMAGISAEPGQAGADAGAGGSALPAAGAGGSAGAGGAPDGGSGGHAPQPPAIINGCRDFVDASADAFARVIAWDFSLGFDPARCLSIAVGQSVTWSGPLGTHPLQAADGTTPNPILADYPPDAVVHAIAFPSPGIFGYVCGNHSTMQGAIRVLE